MVQSGFGWFAAFFCARLTHSATEYGGLCGVLSSTEFRYYKIIAEKIRTGDSDATIADRLGVSRSTVARARDWGQRQGIYETELNEHLLRDLVAWKETEQRILAEWDNALEILQGKNKKGPRVPMDAALLSALSRELARVRTRISELTGVYRKTVNVQHTGTGDNGDIHIKVELVDPDEDADAGTDQ